MTDEKILTMLKKIVEEIDYDIYKEYELEGNAPYKALVRIVKEHLEKV